MLRKTAEFENRQALRRRIARQRRRLDRRINRVVDSVWMFGSLQTFVTQHPARSVLAAAGLGMLLSRLMFRDESLTELRKRLLQGETLARIWRDFLAIFHRETAASAGEEPERG